jgi:hypothetical protein
VQRVTEAVDRTWHRSPPAVAGRIEVPLSVVAALSLLTPDDAAGVAASLSAMPAGVFAGLLRGVWRSYVNLRPDLTPRAYPLFSWLFTNDIPDPLLDAAQNTAHAAVTAGLFEVTGTDARHEVDLLGVLLTEFRSESARKGHAQVYTPTDVAQVMADLLGVDDVAEGGSVHEPAAGTGGLFRAVAQAMRRAGRDPATVRWVAVDIDELAVACLAVNAVLWGLGPDVLLGVGNALTDDWQAQAEGERRECIELAVSIRRDRTVLGLLRPVDAMVDQVAAEKQATRRDQPNGSHATTTAGPGANDDNPTTRGAQAGPADLASPHRTDD